MIRAPGALAVLTLSGVLLAAAGAGAQSVPSDNPYTDSAGATVRGDQGPAPSPPGPAQTSAPSDLDDAPPLTPRFETPSEIAARRERPAFVTPSGRTARRRRMHSGRGAQRAASRAAPSEPAASRGDDYCPLVTRPEDHAYFLEPAGVTFARAPCTGPGASVFYVRGAVSYLSNDFDEWSAAELGWHGSVARDFALGALLHHEYREQRSLSLGAWMSARLHGGLHGYIGVDAGNTTYYAPVTALDLELGNQFAAYPRSYFALGAGTARYDHDRQSWSAHVRHAFALRRGWRGESKIGLSLFDAPTISPRPEPLVALTAVKAFRPDLEGQFQITYTLAPAYRPATPVAETEDHPDLTIALGAKYWFEPTHGCIAELHYERLWGSFDRVGLDYTVLFTGP